MNNNFVKTENYLKILFILLWANLRLIIVSVIALLSFTVILLFVIKPIYQIEGSVIVKSKKVPTAPESTENKSSLKQVLPPSVEDILLETRIISNPDLIRQTVKSLYDEGEFDNVNNQSNPLISFFDKTFKTNFGIIDSTNYRSKRIDLICADIEKRFIPIIFPGSNIVDIKFKYNDPVLGKKIVQKLFEQYIPFRIQLFTDQSASIFYNDQVNHYRNELKSIDSGIVSIMNLNNVSDASRELQVLLQFISQFSEEQEQMVDLHYKNEKQITALQNMIDIYTKVSSGELKIAPPPILDEKDATDKRLNELLIKYYIDLKKYSENSKGFRDIATQIKNELLSVSSSKIEGQKTLKELSEEKKRRLDFMKSKAIKLQQVQLNLDKIKIDIDLNKKKYETFSMRFEESKIEQDAEFIQWANVQILDWPTIPLSPVFPKKEVLLFFGLLSGILLGFALSWTKEFFDHTFKLPSQVETILGLQVIGSIASENYKAIKSYEKK